MTYSEASSNEFFMDLVATSMQAGVPLQKVNHPAMKFFLRKYSKKSVPEESTLRKNYVKPIYDSILLKIKK